MFLLRKLAKRLAVFVIVIVAMYALFNLFYGEPIQFTNNKYKLAIIEDGINSVENQIECLIPDIPVHSPEMMAFIKDEPPIHCDDTEAWVECGVDEHKPWLCFIERTLVDRLGPISCDFSEIIRGDDDFAIVRSQRVRTSEMYELVDSDFVSVKCWTDEWSDRKYWNGLLTGIRKNSINLNPSAKHAIDDDSPLNVIMFGLDSMSRNAFMRKLPRTYQYLTEVLHADVLKGYNIVGDGTPQAIIPLLTGFTELELPETRKRMKDSTTVDVYPFIFNEYARHGYATAFNEDLPNVGTFSYRLQGFRTQPTDHYMRPFYLAFDRESNRHKRLCVGDVPRHNVMLDYTTKIMRAYRDQKPQFAFSFHGELSHDSINLVGVADDDIADWLKSLRVNGLLDRTILIVMSDHGNRFAEVRNTLQGKLEERLPFFSFTFPDAFKTKYADAYAQFKQNVDRLTTPFDVHQTLIDLIDIQTSTESKSWAEMMDTSTAPPEKSSRAISLFKPIPKTRSCADAYIEPHWCSCLSLNFVNTTMPAIKRAAAAIVDRINAYTKVERMCSRLALANISWAGKLMPHQTLLRFKQNLDIDGYLADLRSSTSTKITKELYQLQVTLTPGQSIFEASLVHDLITDKFSVNISDVSRINMYGKQADCIVEKNPDLRKFCYCRESKST